MGGQNSIVFMISAAASLIAENRDDDELNFLAAIYMLLADSIAAIVAARALCPSDNDHDSKDVK